MQVAAKKFSLLAAHISSIYMNFEDLQKELQQQKFRPIYLLQGEETYFIDRLTHYIENNVLHEADRPFNQMLIYGKDTDVDTVISAAYRYPMMSPYQVIIVKEAQNLKDIAKLQVYAEKPLATTILVLAHKQKVIASNTKLYKAIEGKGVVFSAAKIPENQVPTWIQRYVKNHKYQINPDAAALLTEYLGNDLGPIANELDKLLLLLPSTETITMQHIADNIGISKEYNTFELQKAIAIKDIAKVYRITDYFAHNPKAAPLPFLIGSLYRFFSRLFLFHNHQSRPEQETMVAMGLKNTFFLKEYREAARHYTMLKTKQIISLLNEYDLKSKGVDSQAAPPELLKELVFRILN